MIHYMLLFICWLMLCVTLDAHQYPTLQAVQKQWQMPLDGMCDIDDVGKVKVGKIVSGPSSEPSNIVVQEKKVDPIAIALPTKISMAWNTTRILKCTLTPNDAHCELSWSSSNPNVVAVNPDGMVRAIKNGKAVVSVCSTNGLEASCTVEVEEPTFIFHVWMKNGNDLLFNLDKHPRIVYASGKIIVMAGMDRMEFDDADVRKYTIEDRSINRMPEAIHMQQHVELSHLKTIKLQPMLLPVDYDIETDLCWSSSAPNIVSVSQNGEIKALSPGEAIITVQATNGTEATCIVTVPVPTYYMFVQMRNGRHDSYAFADHPIVTHKSNSLFVTSKLGEISYKAEQVRSITFSDKSTLYPTGIEDIREQQMPETTLNQHAGEVCLSGLHSGSKLSVYTTDGKLHKVYRASSEGVIAFSIIEFPKGVYLLKTENITYKIIRK